MDNPSMKFRSFIVFGFLNIFLVAILACSSASAQDPAASKPINLDRDLEEPVANDLASSYYHYSLSQWFENNGDLSKALSEMRLASKYNPNSPAIHVETAILLKRPFALIPRTRILIGFSPTSFLKCEKTKALPKNG
jgi:hypothetical protein